MCGSWSAIRCRGHRWCIPPIAQRIPVSEEPCARIGRARVCGGPGRIPARGYPAPIETVGPNREPYPLPCSKTSAPPVCAPLGKTCWPLSRLRPHEGGAPASTERLTADPPPIPRPFTMSWRTNAGQRVGLGPSRRGGGANETGSDAVRTADGWGREGTIGGARRQGRQ